MAGRRGARHHQPPAREDRVQERREVDQGPVRAHRRVPGAAAPVRDRVRGGVREPRRRHRGLGHAAGLRGPGQAEPGARALRPAAGGAQAGHARRRRAVHRHGAGRRLRGDPARAAAAALPGLRVRPAGLLARGAPGRAAADDDGAVPVHRRRRVRVLHGPAERDRLPPELQRRQLRHPPAGQGLLPLRDPRPGGDGPLLPGAGRDPRAHAHGHRLRRPAAALAPLHDPRDRGRGDAAAGPGPGHDAVADVAALRALRGFYPVRCVARSSRERSAPTTT